jgi:hypothetical protein
MAHRLSLRQSRVNDEERTFGEIPPPILTLETSESSIVGLGRCLLRCSTVRSHCLVFVPVHSAVAYCRKTRYSALVETVHRNVYRFCHYEENDTILLFPPGPLDRSECYDALGGSEVVGTQRAPHNAGAPDAAKILSSTNALGGAKRLDSRNTRGNAKYLHITTAFGPGSSETLAHRDATPGFFAGRLLLPQDRCR